MSVAKDVKACSSVNACKKMMCLIGRNGWIVAHQQEGDDGRIAYNVPRWPLQVTAEPATVTVAGIPTHCAAPGFKSQVVKTYNGLGPWRIQAAQNRLQRYGSSDVGADRCGICRGKVAK